MGLEFQNKIEKLEYIEAVPIVLESISNLTLPELNKFQIEPVSVPETDSIDLSLESPDKLETFFPIEKTEYLHDAEVTEQIAEYLSGVENLKYENWKNLNLEQRTNLLNEIENKIAQLEHRPPLPIKVKKMDPATFGYQDSSNKIIALNSKFVNSNNKQAHKDVIDTIIHEGRHAYQHYNVEQKFVHDSLSVVNTWKENFTNPKYKYYNGNSLIVIGPKKVGDVGFRLYYYQPVEIDARNFASDVMIKLKNKGFMS